MITQSRFRLAELRAAIFFEVIPGLPVVRLLTDFLAEHKDLFDAAPFVLPAEPEGPVPLPAEAPRVELRSKTGKWRMPVALVRADIFLTLATGGDLLTTAMLYETCAPVLDEVADVLQVDIWRLGAVCERFCLDNEPGMTIARFFCRDQWTENDGPLSGSENFELHAHEIRDLSGTKVNSWMRCKSGRVSGLTDGPAIILQQDVNTLADDKSRTYTRSQRSEFFRAAVQEIDRLYALCFPGTERQ